MTTAANTRFIIYLDTGGTFSDAVVVRSDGTFVTGKSPTTPSDLEECFFGCIQDAAAKVGKGLSDVLANTDILGFGTTAGTNALITRVGGPRLGLITTRGFEDTTIIMRHEGRWQGLPMQEGLHIAGSDKPAPLIPRHLICGVTERIDSRGTVAIPLREPEVRAAVRFLVASGVEGIAVALLWSFLNDAHERRVAEIIRELAPEMPTSLSYEVAPVMREYPRFNSTIINLYIGKPVRSLFGKVGRRLREAGYTKQLLVMQSYGGLSRSTVVQPITTLNSGPVGGLVGVEYMKRLYGDTNAMGTDMGGTSFDLSLTRATGAEIVKDPVVSRFTLATPMLGIECIGAGGGTIAHLDRITGQLRLGPESAGAVPGPACYGQGGTRPTVTDADVVTGRIDPDFFLDGKMKLDLRLARQAIEDHVARPLGLSAEEAALGIITGIDGIMKSSIVTFLNKKGMNPRDVVLFVFGGAGPTHGAGYTTGLPLKRVIVPPFASTFSAFGASTADIVHRYEASLYLVLPGLPFDVTTQRFTVTSLDALAPGTAERFNQTFGRLEERALADMADEGFRADEVTLHRFLDMRYGGQLYEVISACPAARITDVSDLKAVLDAFQDEYARLYTPGTQYPRGGVEIITATLQAVATPPAKPRVEARPLGSANPRQALKGRRPVYFQGGWRDAAIYAIERLGAGNVVEGPAIVEGNETTLVIPEGRLARVDPYLNLQLEG